MCFGRSRENKTFTSQQAGAYSATQQTSAAQTQLYNTLNNYMVDRFGQQSQTFSLLSNSLSRVMAQGPDYTGKNPPQIPGGPGGGGGGGGAGGRRTGEGGEGAGLAGWYPTSPNLPDFAAQASKFGFNAGDYTTDYDPQRFWANEEAALRTEASELNTDAFQDASTAAGARFQQLGDMAPGVEAAAMADLYEGQARGESQGQLDVSKFGAQQLGEGMHQLALLKADLQKAMAAGRISASQAAAEYKAAQDQIAASLEAAKMQADATVKAGRAAGRGASQAAQLQYQLGLKQLAQDRYFRSIGAMSGLGAMQDPLGYANTGAGVLNSQGGLWGNLYNTGSQGMQASSRQALWGNILGGALGGLAGMFNPFSASGGGGAKSAATTAASGGAGQW